MPNIVYKFANQDDEGAIRTLLREYYFPDEPMTKNHYQGPSNNEHEEDIIMSLLPEGLSVKAIDEDTGEIVGFLIATEFNPNSVHNAQQSMAEASTRQYADVIGFMARVDELADFSHKNKGQRVIYCYAVAVNNKYRSHNIAYKLNEYYLLNGARMGFDLYTCDCTNAFSTQIAAKQMDCVASLAYADYRDENGRVVFKTVPPHTHVKKFLYKL